jgi:hypothetical protein
MHLQVHRGAPRQWGGDKPPPARAVHLGAPGHGGRSPLRHAATEAGHHASGTQSRPLSVGGGQGRSPAREGMQSLFAPAASRLPPPGWCSVRNPTRTVFLRDEKNRIPSGGGVAAKRRGRVGVRHPEGERGRACPSPFGASREGCHRRWGTQFPP